MGQSEMPRGPMEPVHRLERQEGGGHQVRKLNYVVIAVVINPEMQTRL